jgi:hypothetical protein
MSICFEWNCTFATKRWICGPGSLVFCHKPSLVQSIPILSLLKLVSNFDAASLFLPRCRIGRKTTKKFPESIYASIMHVRTILGI